MILALDVGNTATKAAWFDGAVRRTERLEGGDPAALEAWLGSLLAGGAVDGVALASVVPARTEAVRRAAGGRRLLVAGADPLRLTTRDGPGLSGMGADRRLAAEAAFCAGGGPVIAVTAGTATTFTAVDAQGVVRGGAIAPGLATGAEALFRAGAQLFAVPLEPPPRATAPDTAGALRSGLVLGHAAMIEGLVDRLEAELGSPCRVVATGGWMGVLAPLLRRAVTHEPNLVLLGLARAALATWAPT